MKVIFTPFAQKALDGVYAYYQRKGLGKSGRKIRAAIIRKAMILRDYPYAGQIEEFLLEENKGHRHLMESNYKVIYRIIGQVVYITDIFDTRQGPEKMNP